MDNPLDYRGRVVLVTGGTKGIGHAIARRYAEAGATVVACARTAPDDPAASARTTPEHPGAGVDFVACDVRDADQVTALVDTVVERHGRLDVVVNNAGGGPWADTATASPRFSERIIALNLVAPLVVSQAAYRIMTRQDGGGAIVNIASVSGIRPSPGSAAYGAAKAGLLNLTQTLAVEWAPAVRVNAVVAGLIATDDMETTYGDEATQARMAATVPMGRFGTADDVAGACLFLSSPLAAFVTGAALAVHGGNERPSILEVV
jgi:NAD(P)-dependent dehydrogenase (short-subunit alcohol dehydrogenase family)